MLPEAWPRWLTLLAGAGIVAVFRGTRGCRLHVGVAAALQRGAVRNARSSVPTAPLCLLLGAGYAALLIMGANT